MGSTPVPRVCRGGEREQRVLQFPWLGRGSPELGEGAFQGEGIQIQRLRGGEQTCVCGMANMQSGLGGELGVGQEARSGVTLRIKLDRTQNVQRNAWHFSVFVANDYCVMTVFFLLFKKSPLRDFPGGPVAKTLLSQCRGPGFCPSSGNKSCMPQFKIPCDSAKTQSSQINK